MSSNLALERARFARRSLRALGVKEVRPVPRPLRAGVAVAIGTLLLLLTQTALAACVLGAKSKTRFTRLDTHTIILSGGYGPKILIKTFCFIHSSSDVSVLKDSFCSHENAVLYIDGEMCDVRSVEKLDY